MSATLLGSYKHFMRRARRDARRKLRAGTVDGTRLPRKRKKQLNTENRAIYADLLWEVATRLIRERTARNSSDSQATP